MAYWRDREELSRLDRLRRSYYELLRDDLDEHLLQHALVDSYNRFAQKKIKYPFVEKRELKPRARIPDVEYECQNTFLVIFVEDSIPKTFKKYIRFFDVNKTTKTNLLQSRNLPLDESFDRTRKFVESKHFTDLFNLLLPVDYALLIQRDPAGKISDRYALSHFHVRIDCPIAEASENMAKYLRYISQDLYERGDRYAEMVQKKFFEYYAQPVMSGGRRTAAIVAAQYLKRIPCITTVYAGSSESRAMIRVSEQGVSKTVLMKFSHPKMVDIAESNHLTLNRFKRNFVVARRGKSGICLFETVYAHTHHAEPPQDGKLREIKPDLNWVTVTGQYLLPKPGSKKYAPLPLNIIYT